MTLYILSSMDKLIEIEFIEIIQIGVGSVP